MVTLTTSLTVVLMVLVQRLYIEAYLDDHTEEDCARPGLPLGTCLVVCTSVLTYTRVSTEAEQRMAPPLQSKRIATVTLLQL